MKRCYEIEWFEKNTGHRGDMNHCGSAKKIGDLYYCIHNGDLVGYGGNCASIEPLPTGEQMSLFGDEE